MKNKVLIGYTIPIETKQYALVLLPNYMVDWCLTEHKNPKDCYFVQNGEIITWLHSEDKSEVDKYVKENDFEFLKIKLNEISPDQIGD